MKSFILFLVFISSGAAALGQKWTADALKEKLSDVLLDFKATAPANGETLTMQQMNYAGANRSYQKGDIELIVQIFNYTEAPGIYSSLTALWASGTSYENENEKSNSTKVGTHPAFETIEKTNNATRILIGVNHAIFISIEARNTSDIAALRKVAETLVNKF